MSFILFICFVVNDKSLMHDNSSLEDNLFSTRSILRTSTLQENRFNEEHDKHLSIHNIGMF